ncbi:hypothetical protein V1506DRAFT_549858 [Lipomyces tetrasporus]
MRTWPQPKNRTEMQAFLGMVNWQRDYTPHLAHLAAPVYALTKETARFPLNTRQRQAFFRLRQPACRTIELSTFDEAASADIWSDASKFAIGAFLVQNGKICAVIIRQLSSAERNYNTTDREMLAAHYAIEKWFTMVETCPTLVIRTDHKNIASELKMTMLNRRRNRWILDFQLLPIT